MPQESRKNSQKKEIMSYIKHSGFILSYVPDNSRIIKMFLPCVAFKAKQITGTFALLMGYQQGKLPLNEVVDKSLTSVRVLRWLCM